MFSALLSRFRSRAPFTRFKDGGLPDSSHTQPKNWESSQRYELEHAIGFMQEPFFRKHYADWLAGRLNLSIGYRDALMLSEFFGGEGPAFDAFVAHITGRACLDIGPCVYSPLAAWDVAGQRFAVEPLFAEIDAWQRAHFGTSCYRDLYVYQLPGETFQEALAGRIDGAILCRNMLDHTPRWAFVLGNIAAYAAVGCKLLLWTDLDHRGTADEGHYDITNDSASFKRLVEALGFRVIREHSAERAELNWGCFAEKVFEARSASSS